MGGKRPKIMHIIGSLVYAGSVCGGSEKMFLATLEGLQRIGNTENVGCVISNKPDNLDKGLSAKITALGIPRTEFYPLRALLKLFELPLLFLNILKEDPDVLYCYHNTDDKLVTALIGKLLRKKVVIRKNMEEAYTPMISQFVSPVIFFLCDRVVTIFQMGADELRTMGVPKKKIVYLPNGKNARKFRDASSRRIARKKLGFKEEEFIMGMISRLDPIKNQEAIIYALPNLLEERKDVKFVIVGDHPSHTYKKRLINLIVERKLEEKVLFLGHRGDVEEILPSFDVFVHPSRTDGLPGAVLEAMCVGLPIVASNVGGTKDLLTGCGIMVPPDDIQALTEALKKLMENPKLRQEYGKKARLKAQKEFSLEIMLDRYEKLFKTL